MRLVKAAKASPHAKFYNLRTAIWSINKIAMQVLQLLSQEQVIRNRDESV